MQTIFSVGYWSQLNEVKHPELKTLFIKMNTTVIECRTKNTVAKYAGGFKRFVSWTEKYPEITSILACKELYVALYLQHLIETKDHLVQ